MVGLPVIMKKVPPICILYTMPIHLWNQQSSLQYDESLCHTPVYHGVLSIELNIHSQPKLHNFVLWYQPWYQYRHRSPLKHANLSQPGQYLPAPDYGSHLALAVCRLVIGRPIEQIELSISFGVPHNQDRFYTAGRGPNWLYTANIHTWVISTCGVWKIRQAYPVSVRYQGNVSYIKLTPFNMWVYVHKYIILYWFRSVRGVFFS